MVLKEKQLEVLDFFTRERKKIAGYIRSRVTGINEMDVEDLIQDILVNLFTKIDLTIQVENLTAYVYRSIQNRIIDLLRKGKKTVSLEDVTSGSQGRALNELLFDPKCDLDNQYIEVETNEKLYAALANLEPKQRAVWIATELEGYSFRELSFIWKQPVGTLLSRKHRAVQALKTALVDLRPEIKK